MVYRETHKFLLELRDMVISLENNWMRRGLSEHHYVCKSIEVLPLSEPIFGFLAPKPLSHIALELTVQAALLHMAPGCVLNTTFPLVIRYLLSHQPSKPIFCPCQCQLRSQAKPDLVPKGWISDGQTDGPDII